METIIESAAGLILFLLRSCIVWLALPIAASVFDLTVHPTFVQSMVIYVFARTLIE